MKTEARFSIAALHAAILYSAVTVSAQCQPGVYRCNPDTSSGQSIDVCDVASQWVSVGPCPQGTHCAYINQIPYCVDGAFRDCQPGAVRCAASLSGVETCNSQGHWATTTACTGPERCFAASSPHCAAPCTPGTFQCTASGVTWQRCSPDQVWVDAGSCGANQHCVYGTPPSCIDDPKPECQQGSTYCYIRTTTTAGGRGWAVYGCNTHDHLVPLTDCPDGWTCTTTKTGTDTSAQCTPPVVPAGCVPKIVLTGVGYGVTSTISELRFNFANTLDPVKQFCAVPSPDGALRSGNVEVGKVYDCGRGVQYRMLDATPDALTMDIFVSYTCQGTNYGALIASRLLAWECTPVWTASLLCGKTGVEYRLDPDYTAALDKNGCLPMPVGDTVKLICPGTWA
ncbi:hypothetical protein B0T22DRAFT_539911 [Podospora appendiculata]|uniref:Uncharacterized protein n=1 Tax=Podospora appendiculata TaxID=314037 RepID=A0AAE1C8P3_9PEZI|nr:hypothetical protein B0T22DRAFT_539911 [Podospora appendiculata]